MTGNGAGENRRPKSEVYGVVTVSRKRRFRSS